MRPITTFSIVAYDPTRQEWGVAVQSKFLAVGAVVPWARAGAGAVTTQSYANLTYGPCGLAMMETGMAALEVIEALVNEDEGRAMRQVGLVDQNGQAAAYTGAECHDWAGHIVGDGFACQGNILVPGTVEAMAECYERVRSGPGELADWLVVLPHFPNPRAEHAASIVSGDIDAVEMTSWGDLYNGIDPYSLSDWYRYLNCGYFVPAVGCTDKMTANTAVGTVRTYARIDLGQPFTYANWMEAVRQCETFVTYGPLLEFSVDGRPMGSRIEMSANGGTVDVMWQVASVTVPMSRVVLIVNGEIRESVAVSPDGASGHWSARVEESSWLALLVRGSYADKPEIIAAHSSPVMITIEGSAMLPAADAVTILEQIEGALAYLDTVGTRAEDRAYKRMRLTLEAAHRTFHNRMHQMGYLHRHTPTTDHAEHENAT